jgi:hypothetical protein
VLTWYSTPRGRRIRATNALGRDMVTEAGTMTPMARTLFQCA